MRMNGFHDHIVFADESGDHGPKSPEFPVFVLALCLFKKASYANELSSRIKGIKFKYFGHDTVVFHEREIRKATGAFSILKDPTTRAAFMAELTDLVVTTEFTVIAAVIKKDKLEGKWATRNVYHTALEFCLERVGYELKTKNSSPPLHVVFEARGKTEDRDLELEFRRLASTNQRCARFEPVFASKHGVHPGLELADLIARPIGRAIIDPARPGPQWKVIAPKLRRSPNGEFMGWGLKCFPR